MYAADSKRRKQVRVRSFTEAARELKIDRAAITTLVKIGQIKAVDHPYSRSAKGIDDTNFAKLRRLMVPKSVSLAK